MRGLVLSWLLLLPSQAWATEQVLVGGRPDVNASATAATFMEVNGSSTPNVTEATRQVMIPDAGTLSDLAVIASGAAGAGKSYTIAVSVDASTAGAPSCVIRHSTMTACQDATTVLAVSAGSLLAYKITPAGTPTARSFMASLKFHSDSAQPSRNTVLMGGSLNVAVGNASNTNMAIGFNSGSGTPAFNFSTILPTAGLLKNLYVKLGTAPGGTASYALTVQSAPQGSLSYTSSSVTCTVTGAATTCNDTTNALTITAGDKVTLLIAPAGTPAASVIWAGAVFEPTTAGEFVVGGNLNGNFLTNSAAGYLGAQLTGSAENATETNRQQLANGMIVRTLYVELDSAPNNGAGNQQYTFDFRSGAADAGPTGCVIAEAGTTCSVSSDVTLATSGGDKIDIEITPSGTPLTTNMAAISVLGYLPKARRVLIQ